MRIIMKFSPSVHPEAENDTEEYANRTLSVDPSVFYRFICRRQSVSRYMGNHRINVNPSFYERRKRRHALIINGRLQTLMPASVFVRQASFSPDMEEHPDNRPLYRDGTKLMDIRHVHKRLHDNIWRIFLLYKSIKVHLMKKKDRFDSN